MIFNVGSLKVQLAQTNKKTMTDILPRKRRKKKKQANKNQT